jgi:hypothetical protein
MNPIDEGTLARRLVQMEVHGAADAAARAVDAYRTGHAPRRRWKRGLLVSLAAAALIGVVAASPIAQATTSAIAAQLLEAAGIAPSKAARVARDGTVSATSAGYTVRLVGAYGDQYHTVLFLTVDGGEAAVANADVTDESGRQLKGANSFGPGGLQFQGLTPGRHEITAHMRYLDAQPLREGGSAVRGHWTLTFPLDVTAQQTADATPATGRLGDVNISLNQAGGSGEVLYLQLETTGATIDDLSKEPREGQPQSPTPTGKFTYQVFDAAGHQLTPVQGPEGRVAGKTPEGLRDVLWETYYRGTGPGTYRVVATYDGVSFESRFTLR